MISSKNLKNIKSYASKNRKSLKRYCKTENTVKNKVNTNI